MWSFRSQVATATLPSPMDMRTPSPSPAPGLTHGASPSDSEFGQPTPMSLSSGAVQPEVATPELECHSFRRSAIKQADVVPIPMAWSRVESPRAEVTPSVLTQEAVPKMSGMGTSDFIMISCFDIHRAQAFYSRCFGWTFLGDVNKPGLSDENLRRYGASPYDVQPMNFFTSDPASSSHRVTGALLQRSDPPSRKVEVEARALHGHAACYLRVPDIGEAAERIKYNLGVVKSLRFGVRGCIMDIGEFMDSEGNLFGLMSYHPENVVV